MTHVKVTRVNSASNRNEYQECFLVGKGGRCVGLTTLQPSCADCFEIWEPQPPETLKKYTGTADPVSYAVLAEITLVSVYQST
jgi:hypothetical protein